MRSHWDHRGLRGTRRRAPVPSGVADALDADRPRSSRPARVGQAALALCGLAIRAAPADIGGLESHGPGRPVDLPKSSDYLPLVGTALSTPWIRRAPTRLLRKGIPMTTDKPRVNQWDFVATYKNSVVAIIPDGRLAESTAALAKVGVDLTRVDVLQGEVGAHILDFDGVEHGFGRMWFERCRNSAQRRTNGRTSLGHCAMGNRLLSFPSTVMSLQIFMHEYWKSTAVGGSYISASTPPNNFPTELSSAWPTVLTVLQEARPPLIPDGAEVMTVLIEFPPGRPRHPAPPAPGACLWLHAGGARCSSYWKVSRSVSSAPGMRSGSRAAT